MRNYLFFWISLLGLFNSNLWTVIWSYETILRSLSNWASTLRLVYYFGYVVWHICTTLLVFQETYNWFSVILVIVWTSIRLQFPIAILPNEKIVHCWLLLLLLVNVTTIVWVVRTVQVLRLFQVVLIRVKILLYYLLLVNISCVRWWHRWLWCHWDVLIQWNQATSSWEVILRFFLTLVFFLKFIYFLKNLALILDISLIIVILSLIVIILNL